MANADKDKDKDKDEQKTNARGHDRRQWFEFPDLIAGPVLFRSRDELRAKNLHDTEDPPPRPQPRPPQRRMELPHERWDQQRSVVRAWGRRDPV